MLNKQKTLNILEDKNRELYELFSEKRIFNGAIDHTIVLMENSPEYVEEKRVTYKKQLVRDATRKYRRELELIKEEIELKRTEVFILKERASLS
jgi:hypothetical protein